MAEAKKKSRGYDSRPWRGGEVFACDACPFETEEEARMRAHVAAQHPTGGKA